MLNAERILLISPDGMLGRAFAEYFARQAGGVDTVGYPAIDFTVAETIDRQLRPEHSLVINCSAYTDVDGAEDREDLATAINGTGVGRLAARVRSIGATLLHFSTDYVFSGDAGTPYAVEHPTAPRNAYGRSKAVGERDICASGVDYLLVRTSWMYAPWGSNFVRTMLRLGAAHQKIDVVDDQRGRPTSAEYLAARSMALLKAGARGCHHATDGGECSWYEFACAIMSLAGLDCRVDPCSSDQFPRPATRPSYSVLDLATTEGMLGRSRPWRENLADVVATLLRGESPSPAPKLRTRRP